MEAAVEKLADEVPSAQSATRRVVLIVTDDRRFAHFSAAALQDYGFGTVTAYSAFSGEYALEHHDVDIVVVDGRIVARGSVDRPGPILAKLPKLRLVVINADLLDPLLRDFIASRDGKCLEGRNPEAVASMVDRLAA